MKKVLLLSAAVFTIAAFQSCSKCGHCERTTTGPNYLGQTVTTTTKDETYCGDNTNESGSYAKEEKLNCERWAGEQTPQTGYT